MELISSSCSKTYDFDYTLHVAVFYLIPCHGQLPFIYQAPDSHFQPAKTAWL
jgi:hypothetical protein